MHRIFVSSISIASILSVSLTGWSATHKKQETGYFVRSHLSYQAQEGVIESTKELILTEGNRDWTPFTAPKNGVVLLGKLAKADSQTIHMQYMLVDTRGDSSVISTPAIVTRLGEEAKISVSGGKDHVAISLTAVRTNFTSGH